MLISRRGRWIGECCDGIGWDDRLLAATTPTPIGRALQSDIILVTLHLLLLLLLLQGSSQLLPTPPASSYCAAVQPVRHTTCSPSLLQTPKYLTTFVPNLAASSKPIASPSCPAPPSLTLKHPTILLTTTLESRHFNYHTCDPEC